MTRVRRRHVVVITEGNVRSWSSGLPGQRLDLRGSEVVWAKRTTATGPLFYYLRPGGLIFPRIRSAATLFRLADGRYVVRESFPGGLGVAASEYYEVVDEHTAAYWLWGKSRWHARRLFPGYSFDS